MDLYTPSAFYTRKCIGILFLVFSFYSSYAQKVYFEVKITKVSWVADGDQSGGPDPTWKLWAKDNVNGTETGGGCMSKQDVSTGGGTSTSWDGQSSPYLIRSQSGTTA